MRKTWPKYLGLETEQSGGHISVYIPKDILLFDQDRTLPFAKRIKYEWEDASDISPGSEANTVFWYSQLKVVDGKIDIIIDRNADVRQEGMEQLTSEKKVVMYATIIITSKFPEVAVYLKDRLESDERMKNFKRDLDRRVEKSQRELRRMVKREVFDALNERDEVPGLESGWEISKIGIPGEDEQWVIWKNGSWMGSMSPDGSLSYRGENKTEEENDRPDLADNPIKAAHYIWLKTQKPITESVQTNYRQDIEGLPNWSALRSNVEDGVWLIFNGMVSGVRPVARIYDDGTLRWMDADSHLKIEPGRKDLIGNPNKAARYIWLKNQKPKK